MKILAEKVAKEILGNGLVFERSAHKTDFVSVYLEGVLVGSFQDTGNYSASVSKWTVAVFNRGLPCFTFGEDMAFAPERNF
jgi:hypothetical protein